MVVGRVHHLPKYLRCGHNKSTRIVYNSGAFQVSFAMSGPSAAPPPPPSPPKVMPWAQGFVGHFVPMYRTFRISYTSLGPTSNSMSKCFLLPFDRDPGGAEPRHGWILTWNLLYSRRRMLFNERLLQRVVIEPWPQLLLLLFQKISLKC